MDISLDTSCDLFFRLSALYAQALDQYVKSEYMKDWEKLSKLVIDDLGSIYGLWDKHAPDVKAANKGSLKRVEFRSSLLSKRMGKVQRLLNVWIDEKRWPRTIDFCEVQWRSYLLTMANEGLIPLGLVKPVIQASQDRSKILNEVRQNILKNQQQMKAGYGIAKDLSEAS